MWRKNIFYFKIDCIYVEHIALLLEIDMQLWLMQGRAMSKQIPSTVTKTETEKNLKLHL
jgi:hypothetical protein